MAGKPVTYRAPSPASGVQMETFIPWTLVKRRVRRQIITPLDAPGQFTQEAAQERRERIAAQDTPLMRALGLAHYWQRLLDEGIVFTVADIAVSEDIDVARVRRLMQLALLAPRLLEVYIEPSDRSLENVVRRSWSTVWALQIDSI